MEKKTFENLTTEIVGEQIKFVELENQQAVKWYDKKYIEFSHFAPSKKYGVILDGIVYFDFTAPKSEDGYIKTFLTQYTSKVKKIEIIDGQMIELNKAQKMERIIKTAKNSERLSFGLTYTTLYGFGIWAILINDVNLEKLRDNIEAFFTSKGVKWSNEWSDAGWVYRYKFNAPIEKINDLMSEYKKENGGK